MNKTYQEALSEANDLPTHVNGVLQPHYVMFKQCDFFYSISGDGGLVDVFNAFAKFYRRRGAAGYYTKLVPTYRDNGSMKPKSEWITKIYYHKAWGRVDREITAVEYDIVGIKRVTTNLPSAVLISNLKFI